VCWSTLIQQGIWDIIAIIRKNPSIAISELAEKVGIVNRKFAEGFAVPHGTVNIAETKNQILMCVMQNTAYLLDRLCRNNGSCLIVKTLPLVVFVVTVILF